MHPDTQGTENKINFQKYINILIPYGTPSIHTSVRNHTKFSPVPFSLLLICKALSLTLHSTQLLDAACLNHAQIPTPMP
jgi:gamma-glutamyl phosphate reductase